MCGRISFVSKKKKLHEQLNVVFEPDEMAELPALYNISPTENVPVLLADAPKKLRWMKWGLVPAWSKTGKMNGATFNARSENLTEKPTFRTAFQHRRCLVLADSFYEWKGKNNQPLRIFLKNEDILTLAGLWEVWTDGQQSIETCSVVTCSPNLEMQSVHNRMPLILENDEKRILWMNGSTHEASNLLKNVPPDGLLDMYPVSSLVNQAGRMGDARMHERIVSAPTLFDN